MQSISISYCGLPGILWVCIPVGCEPHAIANLADAYVHAFAECTMFITHVTDVTTEYVSGCHRTTTAFVETKISHLHGPSSGTGTLNGGE